MTKKLSEKPTFLKVFSFIRLFHYETGMVQKRFQRVCIELLSEMELTYIEVLLICM